MFKKLNPFGYNKKDKEVPKENLTKTENPESDSDADDGPKLGRRDRASDDECEDDQKGRAPLAADSEGEDEIASKTSAEAAPSISSVQNENDKAAVEQVFVEASDELKQPSVDINAPPNEETNKKEDVPQWVGDVAESLALDDSLPEQGESKADQEPPATEQVIPEAFATPRDSVDLTAVASAEKEKPSEHDQDKSETVDGPQTAGAVCETTPESSTTESPSVIVSTEPVSSEPVQLTPLQDASEPDEATTPLPTPIVEKEEPPLETDVNLKENQEPESESHPQVVPAVDEFFESSEGENKQPEVNDDDEWIDDNEEMAEEDNEEGQRRSMRRRDRASEGGNSDVAEIEGERQSGDGEEIVDEALLDGQKELDDDEDKSKPAYIPRHGGFYQHDSREGEAEAQERERQAKLSKKMEFIEKNQWKHDMYSDHAQLPKTSTELVHNYGYDIRQDEKPPIATGSRPGKYSRSRPQPKSRGFAPRVRMRGGRISQRNDGGPDRSQSGGRYGAGRPRDMFHKGDNARQSTDEPEEFPALGRDNRYSEGPEPPVSRGAWRGGGGRKFSNERNDLNYQRQSSEAPPPNQRRGRGGFNQERGGFDRRRSSSENYDDGGYQQHPQQRRGRGGGGYRGGFDRPHHQDRDYPQDRGAGGRYPGGDRRGAYRGNYDQQEYRGNRPPPPRREFSNEGRGGFNRAPDRRGRGQEYDRPHASNDARYDGAKEFNYAPRGRGGEGRGRGPPHPQPPPVDENDWPQEDTPDTQRWGDAEAGTQPIECVRALISSRPQAQAADSGSARGGIGRQGSRDDESYDERPQRSGGGFRNAPRGSDRGSRGGGGGYRGGGGGRYNDDDYSRRPVPSMEFHRRRPADEGYGGGGGPRRNENRPPAGNYQQQQSHAYSQRSRDDRGSPKRQPPGPKAGGSSQGGGRQFPQEVPPRFQQHKEQYDQGAEPGEDNLTGRDVRVVQVDSHVNRTATRSPPSTSYAHEAGENVDISATDKGKPKRYSATRQQQQQAGFSTAAPNSNTSSAKTTGTGSLPRVGLPKDPTMIEEFKPSGVVQPPPGSVEMMPPGQMGPQIMSGGPPIAYYNGYPPQDGIIYTNDPNCGMAPPQMVAAPGMGDQYYQQDPPPYCMPRIAMYNPHGHSGGEMAPPPQYLPPQGVPVSMTYAMPLQQQPAEMVFHPDQGDVYMQGPPPPQGPGMVYYDTQQQPHRGQQSMRPKFSLPIVPPPGKPPQAITEKYSQSRPHASKETIYGDRYDTQQEG